MIEFKPWTPQDVRDGAQVSQWLACVVGGLFTLLACFFVWPIMGSVTSRWKVCAAGKHRPDVAGVMSFAIGVLFWAFFIGLDYLWR